MPELAAAAKTRSSLKAMQGGAVSPRQLYQEACALAYMAHLQRGCNFYAIQSPLLSTDFTHLCSATSL